MTSTDPATANKVYTKELGPKGARWPTNTDQWIAVGGMILRVTTGSASYGTEMRDHSDQDEMGICIESPRTVIGGRRFEQYEYRSQLEGVKSGPGDLDLTVFSLRKFSYLATTGNPSILLPLFAPNAQIQYSTKLGKELLGNRDMYLSRIAAERFAGYIRSQRDMLLGKRAGANRTELIERYGYDVKAAMPHEFAWVTKVWSYFLLGR